MMGYWVDYAWALLPKLFFMSISAWPLAVGTWLVVFHFRKGQSGPYHRQLWGSIAAGVVALGLLWRSLFGDALSSSSTAALIFIFVPTYSAAGFGVGYGLAALVQWACRKVTGHAPAPGVRPTLAWYAKPFVIVPITLLAVLLFGIFKQSTHKNELTMAERSAHPDTLHALYQKALDGTADKFGVPLFLAQNPAAPEDILEGLSQHYHSQVRIFVVRHPKTSLATISHMTHDPFPDVREEAQARLQQASGAARVPPSTPD
jgi:hypothetical protein